MTCTDVTDPIGSKQINLKAFKQKYVSDFIRHRGSHSSSRLKHPWALERGLNIGTVKMQKPRGA